MTKTQFRKRTKQLKRQVNKLIDNRIEKFLNSGCEDLTDYEDDYQLPKYFIAACGEEIKFQFKPLYNQGNKIVKNIELFL